MREGKHVRTTAQAWAGAAGVSKRSCGWPVTGQETPSDSVKVAGWGDGPPGAVSLEESLGQGDRRPVRKAAAPGVRF